MSDLEFYCWLEKESLPRGTNFTSDPLDAINFGKRYVSRGNLIIFSTSYENNEFNPILKKSINSPGWYQNNSDLYLNNTMFGIHSPREAVEDYNNRMTKRLIPLFR